MGNTSSKGTSSKVKGKKSSSKSVSTHSTAATTTSADNPDPKTDTQRVVIDFVEARDLKRRNELSDIKTGEWHFPDTGVKMSLKALNKNLQELFAAFPDIDFRYSKIEEPRPGMVVIHDYYGSGTHTGCAYGFPGMPKIPPTGAFIEDEPIRMVFYVHGGKVVSGECDAGGKIVGPPGFYAKCKLASEGLSTKGL